ncbi:MAG: DUF533 domain-containing protein [Alphaproteobacteria bacterium]|nr:DUF533 domain-containing protein [Alphaproteobacteria bacterium]
MSRARDFLDVLNDPSGAPLRGSHPADTALFRLLVHATFADGRVDPRELAMLHKLVPDRTDQEIRNLVLNEARARLNIAELAAALPDQESREEALMLASFTVAEDEELHRREVGLLSKLMDGLGLNPEA